MAALGPRVQFARQRTGCTVMPVPRAAAAAATASLAPGGGSTPGSAQARHVMQTKIVAPSHAGALSQTFV
jgi:hypothetical protein